MINYDYMFDRELINRRALMFFAIFENAMPEKKNKLTPVDLCVALYPNNIDILEFFSSIKLPDYSSEEKVMHKMAKWLEDNHTVFWLLTCECVDDLLKEGKIKYNESGYLYLVKQRNRK
jgi:hypothetical protein